MADTEYVMHSIGHIQSPFNDKSTTPIQSSRSDALGHVIVYPPYAEGLLDLEGFSHIFLLYVFHCSREYSLKVQPFLDDALHGVFSTRYPCRPNPLGLSIVQLLSRQDNILAIKGVDVLDGTPLLDIKPYVPEFDLRTDVRNGWYTTRSRE